MDKKILLVDDAAFMRMLIRNTLTTNGYTNILEAADGEIAVSTYSAEKPDLVIMDITMPNKTGIEALKEIKAMDPGAKVVMCSAMGQEAMVVEAIKLGALDFIVKPFTDADPGEGSFRSRGGKYLRGTIIGHGNVPIKQCMYQLKRAGYDDCISIEFEGMEPVFDALRIGLANLKKYWAEV